MGERILVTGVQVAWSYGDLDGDGYDEIVTMPGPDPDQPAHLRAWNAGGAAVASWTCSTPMCMAIWDWSTAEP